EGTGMRGRCGSRGGFIKEDAAERPSSPAAAAREPLNAGKPYCRRGQVQRRVRPLQPELELPAPLSELLQHPPPPERPRPDVERLVGGDDVERPPPRVADSLHRPPGDDRHRVVLAHPP